MRERITHALIGAVLGAGVGQAVMGFLSDAVSAIFSFEFNDVQRHASGFYALVLLAIVLAAIWFTTPSLSGSAA